MTDDVKVKVLKALSDPVRLDIVRKLAAEGDCDCEKSFEQLSDDSCLSQPSMSHHFSKLADAGILFERKDGRSKYCSLNRDLLTAVGIDIDALTKKTIEKETYV